MTATMAIDMGTGTANRNGDYIPVNPTRSFTTTYKHYPTTYSLKDLFQHYPTATSTCTTVYSANELAALYSDGNYPYYSAVKAAKAQQALWYDTNCTDTTTTATSGYCNYVPLGYGNWAWNATGWHVTTPADRLREIIRKNLAPAIIIRRESLRAPADPREAAARDTLRRVLGDDKYRRFLKHGHVSVKAKSGLVYQIFPGHGITKVYRDGQLIDRLCVVMKGDFPPTDSLIMRFLLILNDEQDFRSHAIQHRISQPVQRAVQPAQENLAERFKRLKLVA